MHPRRRHHPPAAVARLLESIRVRAHYAEPKMLAMGLLGVIGFPAYYVIWTVLFPQPYESLGWRLSLGCLGVPLVLVRAWPDRLRQWLPLYWYCSITLTLPFFFTYMLVMNRFNMVWMMSHTGSIFLLLLLFDIRAAFVTFTVGTLLAAVYCTLVPHPPLPANLIAEMVPVWAFVFLAGGIFNVSRSIEHQIRLSSLTASASTIAHELRTPLAAIKLAATGTLKYLPALVDGYRKASGAGLAVAPVHDAALGAIDSGSEIITTEVDHALVTIEMLLAAARPGDHTRMIPIDARAVVTSAIERYPYGSDDERARVSARIEQDFRYTGSWALSLNILLNLLKNAIFHTARAGRGSIELALRRERGSGFIIVRDTGPGIAPGLLPHVFGRFVTGDAGDGIGMGIGLAFCREAAQRMGGSISCESEFGHYTQFTIALPLLDDEEVEHGSR